MLLGRLDRTGPLGYDLASVGVAGREAERAADLAFGRHPDGSPAGDWVGRVGPFEPLAHRRVVGLPDHRADRDRGRVHRPGLELQLNLSLETRNLELPRLPDPPARLLVLRPAQVEHDAVAG